MILIAFITQMAMVFFFLVGRKISARAFLANPRCLAANIWFGAQNHISQLGSLFD
jgi:hypothetical protein